MRSRSSRLRSRRIASRVRTSETFSPTDGAGFEYYDVTATPLIDGDVLVVGWSTVLFGPNG